MLGMYIYIPETTRGYTVHKAAAGLYLQSALHVILFRPCNMYCTFTSALPAVCVQCTVWIVSVVPRFLVFPVCRSGTV